VTLILWPSTAAECRIVQPLPSDNVCNRDRNSSPSVSMLKLALDSRRAKDRRSSAKFFECPRRLAAVDRTRARSAFWLGSTLTVADPPANLNLVEADYTWITRRPMEPEALRWAHRVGAGRRLSPPKPGALRGSAGQSADGRVSGRPESRAKRRKESGFARSRVRSSPLRRSASQLAGRMASRHLHQESRLCVTPHGRPACASP
jgi:hypothetical protein